MNRVLIDVTIRTWFDLDITIKHYAKFGNSNGMIRGLREIHKQMDQDIEDMIPDSIKLDIAFMTSNQKSKR